MIPRTTGRVLLAMLLLLGLPSRTPSAAKGTVVLASKENLDLPFDAFGSEEEEEEAPEVIFFHGGMYEAQSIVFCLDESLSMRRLNRWEQQLQEISKAIAQLTPNTEFGIIFYGSNASPFRRSLVRATEANKGAALEFLSSRQMSAGTCLAQGLFMALDMLAKSSRPMRSIVVAGDGRPTVCPFVRGRSQLSAEELESLLAQISQRNPGSRTRIHAIYIGMDSDLEATSFMRRLAMRNRGTFRTVGG